MKTKQLSIFLDGGLKASTVRRRKRILEDFKIHVSENELNFDQVLQDPKTLEDQVISFLLSRRVPAGRNSNELVRPKLAYIEAVKSHLKIMLMELSGLDIGNRGLFPNVGKAIKGLKKKIIAEGRGHVEHFDQVPEETLTAIFELLGKVQDLMDARANMEYNRYHECLKKIPHEYRYEISSGHACTQSQLQFFLLGIAIMS